MELSSSPEKFLDTTTLHAGRKKFSKPFPPKRNQDKEHLINLIRQMTSEANTHNNENAPADPDEAVLFIRVRNEEISS